MKAGVLGATGYMAAELMALLASHPEIDLVVAQSESAHGEQVGAVYPSLAAAYDGLRYTRLDLSPAGDPADLDQLDGLDVVFLALGAGEAHRLVPRLLGRVAHVVDLSADFRLKDASLYPEWYGFTHESPDLLRAAAYGLPELYRTAIAGASLVASPGCYVTAASLALAPLASAALIERNGLIVDAASGVSGAGRRPSPTTHFAAVNEGFSAYGLVDHRHTPEIEQVTGCEVLFTPHLAPMTRGILATCYAKVSESADGAVSTESLLEALADAYSGEPFVHVVEAPPSTRHTIGANNCHITARFAPRTGHVIVIAALDNLVKGGAGQALQAANLALGLPETLGLPLVAVTP